MLVLKEISLLKTSKLFPSQASEPCEGDVGAHEQKALKDMEKKKHKGLVLHWNMSLDMLVHDSIP